ncbi:hypothetical protein DM02DRAFT_727749 [Periconia macrospinosa]|uniref:Zn(2)-C6 fungal-type domain-containing protein n=1 Tax=Periconia macrospinosa TaxID=97972 RepID=A0A2V1DUS6_9PLEO|nr:hypothetical protein DM02DRAFT_727749 [Periconia macrospinosa]
MTSEDNIQSSHRPAKKLRSSCDACGFAKVKCDRSQPHCTRCVSLNLNCVYGPSRQSGKKPRRHLGIAHVPGSSARGGLASLPPRHTGNDDSGVDVQYGGEQFTPNVSMVNADAGLNSVSNASNMYNILPTGNENFDDLMFVPNITNLWPPQQHQHQQQQFTTFNPTNVTDHTLPNSTTPEEEEAGGFPNHPPTLPLHPAKDHECYHEPNRVLQSLTIRHPDYGDKATGRPGVNVLPLPQILHANKAAIASFHRFLACGCSKGHPALVMLHASLVSRVLFFYREAAGFVVSEGRSDGYNNGDQYTHNNNTNHSLNHNPNNNTNLPSSSSSSSTTTNNSPSPPQNPSTTTPTASPPPPPRQSCFIITDPPFKIGTFDIEHPDIQTAFRNQLIASEVRKLLPIVAGFVALERDETAKRSAVDGEDHRGLYGDVGRWLEGEYRRTVEVFRGAFGGLGPVGVGT